MSIAIIWCRSFDRPTQPPFQTFSLFPRRLSPAPQKKENAPPSWPGVPPLRLPSASCPVPPFHLPSLAWCAPLASPICRLSGPPLSSPLPGLVCPPCVSHLPVVQTPPFVSPPWPGVQPSQKILPSLSCRLSAPLSGFFFLPVVGPLPPLRFGPSPFVFDPSHFCLPPCLPQLSFAPSPIQKSGPSPCEERGRKIVASKGFNYFFCFFLLGFHAPPGVFVVFWQDRPLYCPFLTP